MAETITALLTIVLVIWGFQIVRKRAMWTPGNPLKAGWRVARPGVSAAGVGFIESLRAAYRLLYANRNRDWRQKIEIAAGIVAIIIVLRVIMLFSTGR